MYENVTDCYYIYSVSIKSCGIFCSGVKQLMILPQVIHFYGIIHFYLFSVQNRTEHLLWYSSRKAELHTKYNIYIKIHRRLFAKR